MESRNCSTYERGVSRVVHRGGEGVGKVGIERSGVIETVRPEDRMGDAEFVCSWYRRGFLLISVSFCGVWRAL